MEINEMLDNLLNRLSSSDVISLLLGMHTKETGMKLLCYGNGNMILGMMAAEIKQISEDTGVPTAEICASLFHATKMMEDKNNE